MSQKIDAYRRVLSRFATGVTVVTAYRGQHPDGVTVSAFSALSMQPPLVLACIGEESDCYQLLSQSEHFAINLLSLEQDPLALAFAELGADKVRALDAFPDLWQRNTAPLLNGAIAHILCRRHAVHEGGDHAIVVGEVLDLHAREESIEPLVYFASEFRRLAPARRVAD